MVKNLVKFFLCTILAGLLMMCLNGCQVVENLTKCEAHLKTLVEELASPENKAKHEKAIKEIETRGVIGNAFGYDVPGFDELSGAYVGGGIAGLGMLLLTAYIRSRGKKDDKVQQEQVAEIKESRAENKGLKEDLVSLKRDVGHVKDLLMVKKG